MIYTKVIKLKTEPKRFYDITREVEEIVEATAVKNGLCIIFCQGSTGAILINEYEIMALQDLLESLKTIAPDERLFHHPDNAQSHVFSSLIGCSKTIPIADGKLLLGQWQNIIFCEFDIAPREREIVVKVISG